MGISEGFFTDTGDAVGYRDTRQISAICEGLFTDTCNAVWDGDIGQIQSYQEGILPDASELTIFSKIDTRQTTL